MFLGSTMDALQHLSKQVALRICSRLVVNVKGILQVYYKPLRKLDSRRYCKATCPVIQRSKKYSTIFD